MSLLPLGRRLYLTDPYYKRLGGGDYFKCVGQIDYEFGRGVAARGVENTTFEMVLVLNTAGVLPTLLSDSQF